jgi:non-canonical purine NTP pyrophosphatase (RdgB/HAM1 family)
VSVVRALVVATSNPHKVREIAQVLEPLGCAVQSLSDMGAQIPEPEEDADTFEGNARIKALAYARALGRPCLAEDSGLEVDALGGAPGVHSARYAGSSGARETRDRANNEKLLAELLRVGARTQAQREARFVCAMCLVDATGQVLFETRGTYEGVIAEHAVGSNGFGYDPLLYLPDLARTSAELSPDEKNARSHRGVATRALHAFLSARPDALG